MPYEVSFGTLATSAPPPAPGQKFRLAVLGDLSGRANAGKLETGAALASRKPIKVDVDNIDTVLERFALKLDLPLAEDGTAVTVEIGEMDDFHPDQLADKLELFESLLSLRKNLASKAGYDRAAKQVLSWSGELPLPRQQKSSRGGAIATDRKLSDFARLTGKPSTTDSAERTVDEMMRRLVGPFVQPARDSKQEQLTARVDLALSAAMSRVLHHPDFQTAEALWRGVDFLVRRIETGARMEIVLYDVSAEELAADLAATDDLQDTGLYGMLVEQPAMDAHQGAFAAVLGLFGFEVSPPHADLLGRVAQVAAAAGAPFLSGIGPDALTIPRHDQNPLIKDAWAALESLPASAYLGLAAPRFLLRMPYGKKSDPIDSFAYEEFTRESGLSGMLWGHPALIPALLLAQGFIKQGPKQKLGSIMGVGDIPYYVYTDPAGDQTALPCTERLYSERQAAQAGTYRVMPLVSLRGRPEVRLASFISVGGVPLAGSWSPPPPPPTPAKKAAPKPADDEDEGTSEHEEEPEDENAEETSSTDDSVAEDTPAEDEPTAAAEEAPASSGDDDLDALLASLSAEPEPTPEGSTEPDLDALLASLG